MKDVMEEIRKKGISIGDRVKVVCPSGEFEGLIMPRPVSSGKGIIVLKLDTGYNTGLTPTSVTLVKKSAPKPASTDKEKKTKGGVAIIGCGGTIASKIEYKTGAVYPSITPKELRTAFPELERWKIHSKQLFSLFSEDMNVIHWRLLADDIEQEIKDGSKGIVVMHGTDTMTYTSAAISYMLQNLPVPIVFVGSQRSSDRPSSENQMNLLNAVYAANQDLGEVALCMHASSNDDFCHLHRGTRVRKMHTSRRDAFQSINSPPLAALDHRTNRFDLLSDHIPRSKGKLVAKKEMNDNVALIYSHPNINPKFISKLDSFDGVVLAGTGLGHVPTDTLGDKSIKSILKPLKELIDSGIPVAMSSQCVSGRVCMRVYRTGRALMGAGVIGDGADWTPEAAYTKMCWVLGQTKDMKEISRLMMTNVAGEITERSVLGGYE